MLDHDQLASIRDADLEDVSGGASRSSANLQLTTALQSVTTSLNDLKTSTANDNNNSVTKLLPFMLMAKMVRGY